MELSEQEIIRRNSLQELINLGINPYPAAKYEVDATAKEINENFDAEKGNFQNISFAGRITGRRVMGKASFVELQDSTGKLQVYVNRDIICPDEDKTLYNTVFKKLLDLGDIIGVKGDVFITQGW
jgi:lysyl-tRNA synthetase class 2